MTWPPDLPFERVLEAARAMDSLALTRLYKRFLPVVYRYALARIGDSHSAEDVTSETFFAMMDGIAHTRARDELTFAAWLLGIARNRVAMHFRRVQARPELGGDALDGVELRSTAEAGDPLDVLTVRESWAEVVAALNQLTEDQRAVVLYRCVLGYPTEDVAALLEKQPGTVRALQFRALASLERYLRKSGASETVMHGPEQIGGIGNVSRR